MGYFNSAIQAANVCASSEAVDSYEYTAGALVLFYFHENISAGNPIVTCHAALGRISVSRARPTEVTRRSFTSLLLLAAVVSRQVLTRASDEEAADVSRVEAKKEYQFAKFQRSLHHLQNRKKFQLKFHRIEDSNHIERLIQLIDN